MGYSGQMLGELFATHKVNVKTQIDANLQLFALGGTNLRELNSGKGLEWHCVVKIL